MSFLLLIPAIVSMWTLAAHYLREVLGEGGPTLLNLFLFTMSVLAPLLFLWRRRRVLRAMQLLLLMSAVVWLGTLWEIFRQRVAAHQPFRALIIIMVSVAAWSVVSALLLEVPALKRRYPPV